MKSTGPITLAVVAACVLAAALAGCTLIPENGETRFYGLIIGIENYTNINHLNYCVDDATALYDALIAHGWDTADITVLTDGSATKTNILSAIATIAGSAGAKDYILIYYSGHGIDVEDKNGDEEDGRDEAIAPVDTAYLFPSILDESTLILDDELRDILKGCRTEKGLIVFDSCNSGGVINKSVETRGTDPYGVWARTFPSGSPGARDIGGSGTNGDLDILNFPVLAASSQDEYSWEDSALSHGVFTYFILSGLEHLRADTNRDGKVSVKELFGYAEIHTESYTESRSWHQHPQIRFSRDFIDILVTR